MQYLIYFAFEIYLAFYLILNLQWFNYSFYRVIFHHKKPLWHLFLFVLPVGVYFIGGRFFWIFFAFALLPFFIKWYSLLDKKLVFTDRVKRFFAIFIFALASHLYFSIRFSKEPSLFLPLIVSFLASFFLEKTLFYFYKKKAKKKLNKINPTIIAITGSYGKTSIKNFIATLLEAKKTPKSVNTLVGIVKDINENLNEDDKIYVVEAGARKRGDIKEIALFLEPEFVVIGRIGPAHIEYFKSLENIKKTKKELLLSPKLKKAFFYEKVEVNLIRSDLNGIEFEVKIESKWEKFRTNLIGKFNAKNLALAILVAKEFGLSIEEIRNRLKKIEPIEHRLNIISKEPKFIIDDSFNGNIDGMLESFEVVKNYKGKKVIVTCGLIEADENLNKRVAKEINKVFDLVILTAEVNKRIFEKIIDKKKLIFVINKGNLETILKHYTKNGDLIIFSNDAPSFF